MMKITKRPAKKDDEALVRKIRRDAYYDVVTEQFGTWDEPAQDIFFKNSWKPETHDIILVDDVPGGYTEIERAADHIYIHELVISPEFQGKGIGTGILAELKEEALKKGVPIYLQVLKKNKAQGLYLRMGFKDVGSTDTHFKMTYSSK